MALLAVPSVDGGFTSSRSPVQILTYLSSLMSIGTIITGLLLIRRVLRLSSKRLSIIYQITSRQYHTQNRESMEAAANFVHSHLHRKFGLEIMAILHSLP
jgi:hypothetical protein